MMVDPRVRAVHCSPDAPAVTVSLAGAEPEHDRDSSRPIGFRESTGYFIAEPDEVVLEVTPATGSDAPLVRTSHEVDSDEMWTLAIVGLAEENNLAVIDLEDEPSPSEDVAHVRFVNTIPDSEPLGFRFHEPVVDDQYFVSRDIAFGHKGTYREVTPGTHRYHIGVDDGREALESPEEQLEMDYEPLLSDERTFDAGHAYTVIAVGRGAADDFEFLVLEDTPTESTRT